MISGWIYKRWKLRAWLPLMMAMALAALPVQAQFETAAGWGQCGIRREQSWRGRV